MGKLLDNVNMVILALVVVVLAGAGGIVFIGPDTPDRLTMLIALITPVVVSLTALLASGHNAGRIGKVEKTVNGPLDASLQKASAGTYQAGGIVEAAKATPGALVPEIHVEPGVLAVPGDEGEHLGSGG